MLGLLTFISVQLDFLPHLVKAIINSLLFAILAFCYISYYEKTKK